MTTQDTRSQAVPMSESTRPGGKSYFNSKMPDLFAFRLGTRGLILLLIAAVGTGVVFDWKWLVAVGIAPIILSVLPCAAMCAIGVCSMGGQNSSCSKKQDAPGSNQVPQDQNTDPSATQLSD